MKSIKTVMKLILATLMHSKIKDFNFIHIISRISIKTSTSEGIKSVKQSHKNHLSSKHVDRHKKAYETMLACIASPLFAATPSSCKAATKSNQNIKIPWHRNKKIQGCKSVIK